MFGLVPWRKERGSGRPAVRPEHPLSFFRGGLDEMFERFFSRWPMPFEGDWLEEYGVEVEMTDEAVLVRLDAPGFEPANFEIQVSGDTLEIVAERKVEGKKEEPPTIERRLTRTLTLPSRIDPEKVAATYHNGVLELRLPRAEPVKRRKVEVKPA
jgi:HSP20 family protein